MQNFSKRQGIRYSNLEHTLRESIKAVNPYVQFLKQTIEQTELDDFQITLKERQESAGSTDIRYLILSMSFVHDSETPFYQKHQQKF